MNSRLLLFLALLAAAHGAAIRPFTIDTVLEDLRQSHPEAARVADDLPPGVIVRENITYTRPEGGDRRVAASRIGFTESPLWGLPPAGIVRCSV